MATQQQADTLDGINVGGYSLRKRPGPASTAAPPKAPKRQKTGGMKAATSEPAGKKAAGKKAAEKEALAARDVPDEGQESQDPDGPGEGGAGTPNDDEPGMPNGAGDPDGGAEAAAEAERDANDRAQLLESVPMIEGMAVAEHIAFFNNRAAANPHRNLAQWLEFYERSVKPAFYHDREWEAVVSQHLLAEEADGIVDVDRQSVRLTALRTIMINLVQSAVLEACLDPDEFLKTEEWNTMRDNLAAQKGVRALVEAYNQDPQVSEFLKSGMLSQVITRRLLEPQAPRTYLFTADRESFIDNAGVRAEKDRRIREQDKMVLKVLQGEMPYSFTDYFQVEEWRRELDTYPEDADPLLDIQNQMRRAVFDEDRQPYGPAELFRLPGWRDAIDNAEGERRATLEALFTKHRRIVLELGPGEGAWRMPIPLIAEWEDEWEALRDNFLAEPSIDARKVRKTYDLIMRYGKSYDQLIRPIPENVNEAFTQYWSRISEHVNLEQNRFDIITWQQGIVDAPNAAERRRLTDAFAIMQKSYSDKGKSYRPDEIPVDYVAVAEGLGYGIDGAEWHFMGAIGADGFGTCTYWVQLDRNARIVAREVLKDTYLRNSWNDPDKWYGNDDTRFPFESHIVRTLDSLPDSENIIQYYSHRPWPDRQMYRIYREYCEHGTLHDLISAYQDLALRNVTTYDGDEIDCDIPHRLLWSVFEGLTAALCLAHAGGIPGTNRQPPVCVPVMHRDIKPGNIFLGAPDEILWPQLPVVKLADWGLVCCDDDDDANVKGVETPGWQAPEQYTYRGVEQGQFPQLPSIASDIWAVGRVMLALVNRTTATTRQRFTVPAPSIRPSVRSLLPRNMVALINACLAMQPDDRPDCDTLWNRIQSEVAVPVGRRGPSIRTRDRSDDEVLIYQLDKYSAWGR